MLPGKSYTCIMLLITIETAEQQKQYLHESGPLVLGRQPSGSERHLVIDEDYISRRHLVLEEVASQRMRFEIVGRNDLELPDGTRLGRGSCGEIALPSRLRIGQTVIHVARQEPEPLPDLDDLPVSDGAEFQTLCLPATRQLQSVTQHPLAKLGGVPSAEKLAVWFETLLSVQRSAVGSTEFYRETARAIVELVGLDRGLVLLREHGGWHIAASWTKDPKVELNFSRSVLSRVVEQGRTFFGTPQPTSVRSSLEGVEAVVGSPILDSNGKVLGVLYGSRDSRPASSHVGIQSLEAQVVQLLASSVSVGLIRMEMQQRLHQAEKLAAVGQAIAYILHDLRGPLGNAQQLIEMLPAGSRTAARQDDERELIEASLAVALELLDDSLEFCRGQVHVKPVRGTFAALLGKHLRLLRMDLQTLGVDLEVEAPGELPVVLDPQRMARVLRNLARNAGEAMQGRTHAVVTIGARQVAAGVELFVADNGPGLPSEVLSKLFQPFSTFGKRGGTGFGLAIARELVEAHRGQIAVVSGADGTRFTIVLPAVSAGDEPTAEPGMAASEAAIPPATATGARRVLLAEDGLVNQRLIGGLLRLGGHSVHLVNNGREAVDAWTSQPFDLLLMDVEMPEMDGLAAVREIRRLEHEQGRRTPIAAVTAHRSDESRAECLAADVDAVLVKPISQHDLDDVIARLTAPSPP
ncbi:MAG: response regulator [Rhodopirellula sp.]|nr:response regulator [Rhodopirellula sp.]